jgi:hypothetical protein
MGKYLNKWMARDWLKVYRRWVVESMEIMAMCVMGHWEEIMVNREQRNIFLLVK